MRILIVTDEKQDWLSGIRGAAALTARRYFEEPESGLDAGGHVLNLCRTGRYQGRGYYVSLLAEARGQHPLPAVKTVEDLKSRAYLGALLDDLQPLMETLKHDESDRFELDTYLGKDPSGRHPALAEQLFANVRAPLLRALFTRAGGRWRLDALHAISVSDIPPQHRVGLIEAAKAYVDDAEVRQPPRKGDGKPRLAILWDPKEPLKPSNDEALQKMLKAAPLVGLDAELITLDDLDRLPEFDALFNRASPEIDGISYEFMRRAEAMGMPVVDDPASIFKCTNKVYMHELLARHQIAAPLTIIVHRGNVDQIIPSLGLPCVLKLPDSGFGLDVVKIETEEKLEQEAERFFKVSELFIAQEWLPTGFDWRIGVYDQRPLFACQYFMAPGHWKILKVDEGQEPIEGESTTMMVGEAPAKVVDMAVRAANLVGRGLYGVDLKEVEGRVYVIEVNCNPNVDAGVEDEAMGDALYRELVGVFARRIAERRGTWSSG